MNIKEMPAGTAVSVRRDDGSITETKTTSKPWLLSGHTWVVMLEGISGCFMLNRCTPAAQGRDAK